jgi:hypothetical protein
MHLYCQNSLNIKSFTLKKMYVQNFLHIMEVDLLKNGYIYIYIPFFTKIDNKVHIKNYYQH